MRKSRFEALYALAEKHPWLADKEDALSYLLYEDCSNDKEREIILSLFNKFKYISNLEFTDCLKRMTDIIVEELNLVEEKTMISATSADSQSDSGQYLLYGVKPFLEEKKWRKHKTSNRYDQVFKIIKDDEAYTSIVLIDEFIGSGKTMVNRIQKIKAVFQQSQTNRQLSFFIVVIAAMKEGVDYINSQINDVNLKYIFHLQKGLPQIYSGNELDINRNILKNLERGRLSSEYEGREMVPLGYSESEALYCREFGNTPNNVYPIFWWAFDSFENERSVVLTRAMGDA